MSTNNSSDNKVSRDYTLVVRSAKNGRYIITNVGDSKKTTISEMAAPNDSVRTISILETRAKQLNNA